MATLALSIAGSFLGPVGTIVGGAVGSYTDQRFLLPSLFPKKGIQGPRLNEFRAQSAEEGAPLNYPFGPDNRMSGTVLWCSDLIEVADTHSQGGKGGPSGPSVTNYTYHVNIAILVAARQISSLLKVTAEGKLVYNSNPNQSVASNVISANLITGTGWYIWELRSPIGGPDLSVFRSGLYATVAGFTNGVNNGSLKCLSSTKNPDGSSKVRFKNKFGVTEASGNTISISQTVPQFSDSQMASISIYTGSESQTADPLIEASEGSGQVPGFRGWAYIVMERFNITNFGNRIPHFLFQVQADASGAISTIFGNMLSLSGLTASDYDVSGLSGTMRGYPLSGPQSIAQVLQPMMMAYDVLDQEGTNGKIRLFHRRDATVIDVLEGDLACREFGDEGAVPVSVDDPADYPLPSEVRVKYIDYENSDQSGVQSARKNQWAQDGVIDVDIPIVLNNSGTEANAIAKRLLWIAWANRQTIKVTLPMRYSRAQENDILRFPADGQMWMLLIQKMDIGGNGVCEFECKVEIQSVLTQTGVAEPPYDHEYIFRIPGDAAGDITEVAPIHDGSTQETITPTLVVASALQDPEETFTAISLMESKDDVLYTIIKTLFKEATIGFALTTLGNATSGSIDMASSLDVEVLNGTLESVTELEMLLGANRALIGSEIIGFKTATLIGTRQYRLTNLLRGLQGTDWAKASHAADERFVHLNSQGVETHSLNFSAIGETRYYRFVPVGGNVDDAETYTRTITGESLKPFRPSQLAFTKDSSSNVTLTWVRNSRSLARIFAEMEVPLVESLERYEVEIWNNTDTTLLRTIVVDDATTTSYSAANQTTDGVGAGGPFKVRIYQMSSVVGRGRVSEVLQVTAS